MKRWIILLLAMCLLFSLAACGKPVPDKSEVSSEVRPGSSTSENQSVISPVTDETDPQPESSSPLETEQPLPELPPADGTTTLMVYLMGSDLESKTGAGTNDLTEIAGSGVDPEACTVLVYTGGSAYWHNALTDESENAILRLTPEGFEVLDHLELRSMGEPETLTDFLTRCVELAPADHYALILWDHGNGPVIGYGKDTLYKNDALTLSEMRLAMEASPFGDALRLDWVGFDACLMASAELAVIWAPYADYLVASQEVEPAFGWAYSFLRGLGRLPTEELLGTLTDYYLDACLDYYDQKGYSDRDTTLACLRLSAVPDLEDAMDALFTAMGSDAEDRYDELAASRVDTRALSRTSTGSEYDLVDLEDLAARMTEFYPGEGAALTEAINKLVVVNATNAEGLSGLSLYYPFFNKDYYRERWADSYEELGLFPAYRSYLRTYAENWLMLDLPIDAAQSRLPSQLNPQTFTLQLSPEEEAAFASARYYILKQEGDEAFTQIFSSDDVTLSRGVLTANFDGKVIYVCSDYGKIFIPVCQQFDTVGSVTRYGVNATLTNDTDYDIFDQPADFSESRAYCRVLLNLDRSSGEVSVSAIQPQESEQASRALVSGKEPEPELSDYTTFIFPEAAHKTLSRYSNGLVRPMDQWFSNSVVSYSQFPIPQGVHFLYRPLNYGRYVLLFEVQDTHGNFYCSEPLTISAGSDTDWISELSRPQPEPVTTDWDGTEEDTLYEEAGVRFFLKWEEDAWSGEKKLVAGVKNDSDRNLAINCSNLLINGDVFCDDGYYGLFYPKAGEEETNLGVSFGNAKKLGVIDKVESIAFSVEIKDCDTRELLVTNQWVRVKLPEHWEMPAEKTYDVKKITEPFGGAMAEEQLLFDQDGIRFRMLRLGRNPNGYAPTQAVFCMENAGSFAVHFRVDGLQVNDMFVPISSVRSTVYPGTKVYTLASIEDEDLEPYGITDVQNVSVCVRASGDSMEVFQGYGEVFWLPVALSQTSDRASTLPTGDRAVYENDKVRISMRTGEDGYQCTDYKQQWYLTVENKTDEGMSYQLLDKAIEDVALPQNDYRITGSQKQVGPRQSTIWPITLYFEADLDYSKENPAKEISFRFLFQNFTSSVDLWQTDEPVRLTAPSSD